MCFSSGLYTNTHTQPQTLLKHMSSSDADLNAPNEEGDSPIHAIIRRKRKKRADLLLTLLVNGCSRVDLDRCSMVSGETALHLAVMVSECIFLQYACAVSPARPRLSRDLAARFVELYSVGLHVGSSAF